MASLVALLFVVGAVVLALYFRFPPQHTNKKQIAVFNWMVLGVCAFLCAMWALNVRTSLIDTEDEHWIGPFSMAGALGIEIVFLTISFVLRNFWIFRVRRPNGGYF